VMLSIVWELNEIMSTSKLQLLKIANSRSQLKL
jgi:hypothetical protein